MKEDTQGRMHMMLWKKTVREECPIMNKSTGNENYALMHIDRTCEQQKYEP
jgi:hypothetical protein